MEFQHTMTTEAAGLTQMQNIGWVQAIKNVEYVLRTRHKRDQKPTDRDRKQEASDAISL